MTQIQILNEKRYPSYIEISYKMRFLLPAIYGTGTSPIAGIESIVRSFPDSFSLEVIPVTGTVIVYTQSISVDLSVTLGQGQTFLQNKYSSIRTQLDALTLTPYDNIAGLSWDGATWGSSNLITDVSVVNDKQANNMLTATGATGAAVTLTIPAAVGVFHNISHLSIQAYSTAARTGSATPVIVTTTNLNGVAFTFATAAAIGTTDFKVIESAYPVKSVLANTATTIVCPATTGVIWRVNCFYNLST